MQPPENTAGPLPAVPPDEGAKQRHVARDARAFRKGFFSGLGLLVALGLVLALMQLKQIIILVGFSMFIALGMNRVVKSLVKRGVPHALALALIGIVVLALVVAGVWIFVPLVASQLAGLTASAPQVLDQLQTNPAVARWDAQFHVIDRVSAFVASGSWVNDLFGGIVGAGTAVANGVFSTFMTIILTLYFLASATAIENTLVELAPASKRPRARYLAQQILDRIGGYLTGMTLVVALWFGVTFAVTNFTGLGGYSLALAMLVGMLAAIPAVGSSIGLIICSLVALTVSPHAALITLITLIAYQQMDAYLVQPRLFSRSLNVPPVMVVLGALCGALLLGVAGALLAIPIVASLLLLYREIIVPTLDAA